MIAQVRFGLIKNKEQLQMKYAVLTHNSKPHVASFVRACKLRCAVAWELNVNFTSINCLQFCFRESGFTAATQAADTTLALQNLRISALRRAYLPHARIVTKFLDFFSTPP